MKALLKRWLISTAVAAVLAALVTGQATAAGNEDRFYAASERFGYTGTVSVYNTWADANSGQNARCTGIAWPQRDGSLFVVKNVPEYYSDANMILTNWFANDGHSNPSNTNNGFFQLYDENTDAWQNQKASWSRDLSTFTVSAKGRNATYGSPDPEDYARLWNACAAPGSGESTIGTFLRYQYEFVATGLNGVKDPSGFIRNTTDASDYRGHFSGIFHNESLKHPESNGYYVFNIEFNNISWAVNGNYALPDEFGGKKQTGK